jgi:hypothetical protein
MFLCIFVEIITAEKRNDAMLIACLCTKLPRNK